MKLLSLQTLRKIPILKENRKIISRFIITLFFIAIGIWFIKHEKTELLQVKTLLLTAKLEWLLFGILLTVVYIVLQGWMYVASFAAIQSKINLYDGIILFLKRNFISVFLPAGGISSLAFFVQDIERKGISKAKIHTASSLYAFVGILSVVVVAIPAFLFTLFLQKTESLEWLALAGVVLITIILFILYKAIRNKGRLYKRLIHYFPAAALYLDGLQREEISKSPFILVGLISILIEITGMVHVYLAMVALQLEPSIAAAVLSYIVAVIFLIVSPFLRGFGAIEISMGYLLVRFGYTEAAAISITFLYRFLEFWLPLLAGALSFLLKLNKLLLRVIPALLLLLLGIVNLVSVLTPAIHFRVHLLRDFLPLSTIQASGYFMLITALFLLVTAAFMLKGLRMAWYFAMGLCIVSVFGNLFKAFDYEESIFALLTIIILLLSRKEYYVKNDRKLRILGIKTMLLSAAAVLLYGGIGFYYLDEKHFKIDFSWYESVRFTLQYFFLIGNDALIPQDTFARSFLYSIQMGGFLCISFFIYTLVRPHIFRQRTDKNDFERAKDWLLLYGDSPLDYFKVYPDKTIFIDDRLEGFIAYRVAGNFAVVLEGPVGPQTMLTDLLKSFESYCYQHGLRCVYYRVPPQKLHLYPDKKKINLGQEGVVNLNTFTLEGGARKSLRNAEKKCRDQGFYSQVYHHPLSDDLIKKLQYVSDEWLRDTKRSEIVFSQGIFLPEELKEHTVMTIENAERGIVAFLDLIPDYVEGEGTYDLIRKTSAAPPGVIDFLQLELFRFLKSMGCERVNLGFAPLSGNLSPQTFPEISMKFAYDKIRTFSHYKGLREFKDKFSPEWEHRYLVFDQDYDLVSMPSILTKVIKP